MHACCVLWCSHFAASDALPFQPSLLAAAALAPQHHVSLHLPAAQLRLAFSSTPELLMEGTWRLDEALNMIVYELRAEALRSMYKTLEPLSMCDEEEEEEDGEGDESGEFCAGLAAALPGLYDA